MIGTVSKLRRGISFADRSRTPGWRGSRGTLAIVALCFLGATACAPEVGSERWCENMKEKAKVDWSPREASDFAKHCLFRN